MTPAAGSPVRVRITKWGDRPHWRFSGVLLGTNDHGDWIGLPAGTTYRRPGLAFVGTNHQVTLVPAAVDGVRPGWLATFHDPDGATWMPRLAAPVQVYVDLTTSPAWDGDTLRAVDLDLDVVRATTLETMVDDEDEFEVHRRELGYPDAVVATTRATCAWLAGAVGDRVPPFDPQTPAPWLARVSSPTPT